MFYYLTYAGGINTEKIKDDALRMATELQIAHFGQIPLQLFKTPHPSRDTGSWTATIATTLGGAGGIPRPVKKNFSAASLSSPSPSSSSSSSSSPTMHTATGAATASVAGSGAVAAAPAAAKIPGGGSRLLEAGMSRATSEEESLAITSPCAAVFRRQIFARSPSTPTLTASRPSNLTTTAACGNILAFNVLTEKVVCVLDTGVVEVHILLADFSDFSYTHYLTALHRLSPTVIKSPPYTYYLPCSQPPTGVQVQHLRGGERAVANECEQIFQRRGQRGHNFLR